MCCDTLSEVAEVNCKSFTIEPLHSVAEKLENHEVT
jgi:hypothetical protein